MSYRATDDDVERYLNVVRPLPRDTEEQRREAIRVGLTGFARRLNPRTDGSGYDSFQCILDHEHPDTQATKRFGSANITLEQGDQQITLSREEVLRLRHLTRFYKRDKACSTK